MLMLPPTIWLVVKSPKLRQWFVSSTIVRLFGLYVLLHLVLGIWALVQDRVNSEALVYSYIINLRFIAFFILCVILAGCSNFLVRNWRAILLAPATIVVVFGLVQKFLLPYDFLKHFGYGPKTIPAYQTVDQDLSLRRIQSTLRGANPLGAYLILIITGVVVILRRKFIWLGLSLIAAMILTFFSYSRSGALGLMIALGFLFYLGSGQKIKRWLPVLAIALLLAASGIYLLRSNNTVQDTLFHDSETTSSPQSSNTVRLASLKNGVLDVTHHPLGEGPGTAGPASFRNEDRTRISENYFLQIGQEIGILGMGLFIVINALVAKGLWRLRHELLPKILLASLVGITFVNLVSHAWADDTLAYLWWGLAGVALAPRLIKRVKA